MEGRRVRALSIAVGGAWVAVAAFGLVWAGADLGEDWEVTYALYQAALLVAAVLTVTVVARASRASHRPGVRTAGLVVSGIGVAATFVAWALPLWMTLLGIGLATVAVASASGPRPALGLIAAAPLLGLAAMVAGVAGEVGRRDEWGDYPVAAGIALAVTAAVTLAGLAVLRLRTFEASPLREAA